MLLPGNDMKNPVELAASHGKPAWRPMLRYLAELHQYSTLPARPPFPFEWEHIGPGYCYGPAFGHWDIVHAALDVMAFDPEHARKQLMNNLALQQPDGMLPGSIWMAGERPEWEEAYGHPPVWPQAANDLVKLTGDSNLMRAWYQALARQVGWFEQNRQAEPLGFYYADILTGDRLENRFWESGVDEGIRFDEIPHQALACVDATSHVYSLYSLLAEWAEMLGENPASYQEKAGRLRKFIQSELFVEDSGFFFDVWSVKDPARPFSYEGIWPVVMGAATPEQARRVIEENLLNPERFFTPHPISTVSRSDPRFELRVWRGPTWNSMTYWAARGCLRYGYPQAARALLEKALDSSAVQFERTGTIWEYYHPFAGEQGDLGRKPHTEFNQPCKDYVGHNPLIAMTLLFESISANEPGQAPQIGFVEKE